jgi:manganese oxidase
LGGFFIALPEKQDGNRKGVKDFAIMLQEFTLQKGTEEPVIFSMDPNWFTFNGISSPNIPALVVNQGDAVRIRYGNLGELSHPIHLHGYSFNVTGTEGGPIQKSAQWPAATVEISPGQARDIQFIANNPGVWRLHCHKLLHIVNDNSYWTQLQIVQNLGVLPVGGMFSFLVVKQNPNDDSPYWDTLP